MPCTNPCDAMGNVGTCCGMTCADLTQDTHNCGTCGHDCGGGSCVQSTCQVVQLLPLTNSFLALDATYVYYAEGHAINRLPIAGGAAAVVATTSTTPPTLAVAGGSVYYTDSALGVWSVPSAGGTPVEIATDPGNQSYGQQTLAVAADAANVYWTTWAQGSVLQAPNGGGGPITQLASGLTYLQIDGRPYNIAVGGGYVYWSNSGGGKSSVDDQGTINRAPIGGGTVQVIASGQAFPYGIAIDGTSVYWVAMGTIANDLTDGKVWKAPLAGGTATPLTGTLMAGSYLAVDQTYVYFTSGTSVVKVPKATGSTNPTVLASLPAAGQATPIVVDANNIYWSSDGIYKLAK